MSFNYEEMGWADVRDLFRKWRRDNERRSEDVIQLWEAVLEDRVQKTGNERHIILEQVILAALDTARLDIASKCTKQLSIDFPGSMRVMKYKAMRLEAMKKFEDAVEIHDAIIAKDETNAAPRKRKIAVLEAMGRRVDAIKELTEYLKKFMSDPEGWHQLCNLYMAEGDYAKAAFCMEEVLLHNPHCHLIHQRIGEIHYTMGGMDNIEIARTHFTQAINLNSNNLRALYGLFLCCSLIGNSKVTGPKRRDAQKTATWALGQATTRTLARSKIENNTELISSLENAFGSLDIKSN